MRVLYDHQVFSLQNAGGGSRYYYQLARYLSNVPDVSTNLLLCSNDTVYPFTQLASANVRVISFGNTLLPGGQRYVANEFLASCIVPFLGKMDVYHPTHHRVMPLVRACRIVATHHDCTHERFPHGFRYLDKVLRAKKLLYDRADVIICVSEASRKDLLNFYAVEEAKTRVIYHGVSSLSRCQEAAERLRARLRRDYVLFVGRRGLYKNFAGLLKAFHETRLSDSFDLLAVGGGPLTSAESALIASLNLSESVINIPMASDEILAESYAGAKVFVYPSLWEGFGFPPLEAMSFGCPVVATNASSIPEVCQDAPFYFEADDPDSFNRALLKAIDDEEARWRASARGREVAAQYRWEKCGEETLALYRECQA